MKIYFPFYILFAFLLSYSCKKNIPHDISSSDNKLMNYSSEDSGTAPNCLDEKCDSKHQNYTIAVDHQSLVFKNLPTTFNGFRIGIFSDLHLQYMSNDDLRKVVKSFKNKDLDIIIFAGDLIVESTDEFTTEKKKVLLELNKCCKYGIFGVYGNHDYEVYKGFGNSKVPIDNKEKMKFIYNELKWNLLENEHIILRKGSDALKIVGIEYLGIISVVKNRGDLKKAVKCCKKNIFLDKKADSSKANTPFSILIAHDPNGWEPIKKNYYFPLTISGHTHGYPFAFDLNLYNPSNWMKALKPKSISEYNMNLEDIKTEHGTINHKYYGGLYESYQNKKVEYLYVNRGVGFFGMNLGKFKLFDKTVDMSIPLRNRMGVKPEIAILELKKK